MLFNEVVATSERITGAAGRLEKTSHLTELLRRTAAEEIAIAIRILLEVDRLVTMGHFS